MVSKPHLKKTHPIRTTPRPAGGASDATGPWRPSQCLLQGEWWKAVLQGFHHIASGRKARISWGYHGDIMGISWDIMGYSGDIMGI